MRIHNFAQLVLVSALGLSSVAHAELQARDLDGNNSTVEAYYDTDIAVTWFTSGDNGFGTGNYGNSRDWTSSSLGVAEFSLTDGINVYDDWRLPTLAEMEHLYFVEFSGVAGEYLLTNGDPDPLKFQSICGGFCWSSESAGIDEGGNQIAWGFSFSSGDIGTYIKHGQAHAWAVSSGDVGIAAVPEPETYAMLLVGLGLVGAAVRRRKLAQV